MYIYIILQYGEAYRSIDAFHKHLFRLEADAKNFKNLEELFELAPTRHTKLAELRQQLVMLKHVWDMVGLNENTETNHS